jgi:TonB family protein
MRLSLPAAPPPEVYTAEEVARAAGVPTRHVTGLVETGQVFSSDGFIPQADAVRLVRRLTGRSRPSRTDRMPITLVPRSRRNRGGMSFATSTLLHGTLALLLALASALGWVAARDTEEPVRQDRPVRLVFLATPGPGGGGGGGGLRMPAPPPPAKAKAPERQRVASPVPPVRRVATPPRPAPRRPPERVIPQPRPEEAPLPMPSLQHAIQAPVAPIAGDAIELSGLPDPPAPAQAPSSGPGSGGGIGSGRGAGLGNGDGGGIGEGSGGGTGGGPYRPGSGIEPPILVREVRAAYTSEARRQAVEGEVVLEVVVRRDGSVGNPRVVRGLGAGLDQKALEAVRQWRFTPARRQGAPVDVVVTISVEFTLR